MPVEKRRKSEILSRHLFEKFNVLTVVGGVFGFYYSANLKVLSYTMYVVLYFGVGVSTLGVLYTSILLVNNMAMFSFAFHIFLVGCVIITASVSLTLQRKRLTRLYCALDIGEEMAEYQHGRYWEELRRQTDQRLLKIMFTFLVGYGICGLVGVSVPFIDMYLGYDELVTNVTGIYWKGLPYATWFPFDAHESTAAWIIVYLCQGVFATSAPIITTAAIMFFFYACECLLNHIKLLIFSLKHLDQRAKALLQKRENTKSSTANLESEFELCYYESIVQNIKHHQNIIK